MTNEMSDSELRPLEHFSSMDVETAAPVAVMRAHLPPPGTRRWVARRKADVVNAVRNGVLSLEEACARYSLSVEEFLSWQRDLVHHGVSGLRTTRIQDHRRRPTANEHAA